MTTSAATVAISTNGTSRLRRSTMDSRLRQRGLISAAIGAWAFTCPAYHKIVA
jgi:hypothetical protein